MFERNKTVFKDWIEDTPEMIRACFDHDKLLWKIDKLAKNPKDQEEIMEIFERHGELLKNLFLTLASKCTFPQISAMSFVEACEGWGIIEKDKLTTTQAL